MQSKRALDQALRRFIAYQLLSAFDTEIGITDEADGVSVRVPVEDRRIAKDEGEDTIPDWGGKMSEDAWAARSG